MRIHKANVFALDSTVCPGRSKPVEADDLPKIESATEGFVTIDMRVCPKRVDASTNFRCNIIRTYIPVGHIIATEENGGVSTCSTKNLAEAFEDTGPRSYTCSSSVSENSIVADKALMYGVDAKVNLNKNYL